MDENKIEALYKQIDLLKKDNRTLKEELKKCRPADERLRSIIESSEIAVIDYLIPISYHLYHCHEFAKILGYEDDENFLLNKEIDWFVKRIHKEDYQKIKPTIENLQAGNIDSAHFEVRFLNKKKCMDLSESLLHNKKTRKKRDHSCISGSARYYRAAND